MKIIFIKSAFEREDQLAAAMLKGIPACGDEIELAELVKSESPHELDADFLFFVGLKSQNWMKWCTANGQRFVYFDKGYYHREFEQRKHIILWRSSVDAFQPTEYIAKAKHNPERWLKLQRDLSPWQEPSPKGHIIIANSSEKYHRYHDLPHPTVWVENLVKEIRQHTHREIWYRPKPSWREKRPVPGTKYCPREPVAQLVTRCHALITHGSYISVDALLHGVPGVILGPAVTRPISSTSIDEILEPRRASEDERMQVLANMAWCQYRLEEWQSGFAWSSLKRLFL